MIQLTFLCVHEKTLLKDNNLFSVCHRFPKFFHLSSEKVDPNWAHRQWQICDDPADEGYTSQIAKQTKKATSGYLAKQHWTADPAKVATICGSKISFTQRVPRLISKKKIDSSLQFSYLFLPKKNKTKQENRVNLVQLQRKNITTFRY